MSEKFECWCLVELFGHSKIAGYVTEQSIGGQSFVRVDVPETKRQKGFTRLFGSGAIYAMNPVAEDIARGLAETMEVTAISMWDLPPDIREKIRAGEKLLTAKALPNGEPMQPDEESFDDDFDADQE